MASQHLAKQDVASLSLLGIITLLIYHLLRTYWRLSHVPGPLVAKFTNLHRFVLARSGFIHLYQARAHHRYGPLVRFGPNLVSVCDPEAIPTIFHMRVGLNKSKMYRAFRPWTADNGLLLSVFTAENDAVSRQLKQHVALYYSLSYTVATFEQRVDSAILTLFAQFDAKPVRVGEQPAHFDLTRWFKYFSYDAMGLMTFSRPYGYLQQQGQDTVISSIMQDVKKSMLTIGPMTQLPWLDWLLHKNRLANLIRSEAISPLLMYVLKRIGERQYVRPDMSHDGTALEPGKNGPDAGGDFLSYFLRAQEKDAHKVPMRFVSTWTLANILGGSDSTASVLRSVVCFLVEHPEAMEIARAELLQEDRTISYPVPKWCELQNLPFLDACIKESVRLEPPFAMVLERVVPPGGVTICGSFYPGGTVVGMSPYITNRYKPTWGDDAEIWRPNRWLESDAAHVSKLEASLLSFGGGTRTCLGQHIAMFEIKKLVVALLINYDIVLVEPREMVNRYSWVIMPEAVQATLKRKAEKDFVW